LGTGLGIVPAVKGAHDDVNAVAQDFMAGAAAYGAIYEDTNPDGFPAFSDFTTFTDNLASSAEVIAPQYQMNLGSELFGVGPSNNDYSTGSDDNGGYGGGGLFDDYLTVFPDGPRGGGIGAHHDVVPTSYTLTSSLV
jgi:hypothetical protein